jgi:hypothetical protein
MLAAASRRPDVLGPLKVSRFQSVEQTTLATWVESAAAAPAPMQPTETPAQPAETPAQPTEPPQAEGQSASQPPSGS